MQTKLYGFTLLRNGLKYDYSFRECLKALSGLVEKIYIAVGDSEDGTLEALEEFPNLVIINTKWDPKLMGDGGQILSEQTNIALKKLREDISDPHAWGIYLQCDEMIHEDEIEQIRTDIEVANEKGYDALRFRYLHFWKDHYHIAISKRWYPQEVRAIKLDSDILSFGDAQGFSGVTKPYESECHIFHYGHVRDEEKLAEKQKQLIRFIRPAEKFDKYFNREKKAFSKTKTLKVLINHPRVMKERIERLGDKFELNFKTNDQEVFIQGDASEFDSRVIEKIAARKVHFVKSKKEVPSRWRSNYINFGGSTIERIFSSSKVPLKMESPIAREWNKDFLLVLKLSEKNFYLKTK